MAKEICEIYLNKGATKKVAAGYPWVFVDHITNPSTLATSSNAELAHVHGVRGEFLGSALIDKNSKLALRIFDQRKVVAVDLDFFASRFQIAKNKRDNSTHYRLINYEGDGLGGLCIERFGEHFKIDASLEFYFLHRKLIAQALIQLFNPASIIMTFAGSSYPLHSTPSSPLLIEEGGIKFYVDILHGQKTGWYYDQRENRRLIKGLAQGTKVLDCFCYSGGFGINALTGGASHVTFIDSSLPALKLAEQNAALNGFNNYNICVGDAEVCMLDLLEQGSLFNLIILDPPPLIKNKQSKPAALKKYQKIATLGLKLLEDGGHLLYSSCSHHMYKSDLRKMLSCAAKDAGYGVEIIKETGHAFDHPTCKNLPESVYLNSILVRKYV